MYNKQLQQIKELKNLELHQSKDWVHYWQQYSSFNNWHFWVTLALLVIPLILLFIYMDKRKSLLLGFYGYNVHVFFTYIDVLGSENTFWFYPYKVLPILSSNLTLDVSLVPVCYMFVYQWALNHKQNYYALMFGLSIVLAFVLKPIMEALGLFQIENGANYVHLFLGYLLVGIFAKQITNLFLFLQRKSQKEI